MQMEMIWHSYLLYCVRATLDIYRLQAHLNASYASHAVCLKLLPLVVSIVCHMVNVKPVKDLPVFPFLLFNTSHMLQWRFMNELLCSQSPLLHFGVAFCMKQVAVICHVRVLYCVT